MNRDWVVGPVCGTCGQHFTERGWPHHRCKGPKPPPPDPWRLCRHCAKRFTTKGIARHEQACMPEVTHDCETCGQQFRTPRMLSLHRGKAHPGGAAPDHRLARLRTIAAGRGWLVVSDEPDCVLAVRVAEPLRVVHARIDGDAVVGRCVTRQHLPGIDEPVALALKLSGVEDVRAILELAP